MGMIDFQFTCKQYSTNLSIIWPVITLVVRQNIPLYSLEWLSELSLHRSQWAIQDYFRAEKWGGGVNLLLWLLTTLSEGSVVPSTDYMLATPPSTAGVLLWSLSLSLNLGRALPAWKIPWHWSFWKKDVSMLIFCFLNFFIVPLFTKGKAKRHLTAWLTGKASISAS